MNKIDIKIADTMRAIAKDFVDGSLENTDTWRKEWDKASTHLTPDEVFTIRKMMISCFLGGGVVCSRDETYREGFATYARVMKELVGSPESKL